MTGRGRAKTSQIPTDCLIARCLSKHPVSRRHGFPDHCYTELIGYIFCQVADKLQRDPTIDLEATGLVAYLNPRGPLSGPHTFWDCERGRWVWVNVL